MHHAQNSLNGHDISEENRTRIIDWMVQVFRVLKVSSAETFFLAVTILDNYLRAKSLQGVVLTSDCLYLLGMTIIFTSSKYEDIIPISMKHLIDDVGHYKFTRTQINSLERDILSTL